jgi:hypothetical protein
MSHLPGAGALLCGAGPFVLHHSLDIQIGDALTLFFAIAALCNADAQFVEARTSHAN